MEIRTHHHGNHKTKGKHHHEWTQKHHPQNPTHHPRHVGRRKAAWRHAAIRGPALYVARHRRRPADPSPPQFRNPQFRNPQSPSATCHLSPVTCHTDFAGDRLARPPARPCRRHRENRPRRHPVPTLTVRLSTLTPLSSGWTTAGGAS